MRRVGAVQFRLPERARPTKAPEKGKIAKVSEYLAMGLVVPARCGIVYCTMINDTVHFCFGVDTKTGDIADFGGGGKESENAVHVAIREGGEESREVFGRLTLEKVQRFYCIYTANVFVIFVKVCVVDDHVDVRYKTISDFDSFRQITPAKQKQREFNEMKEILWLNEKDTHSVINGVHSGYTMYSVVRNVLRTSPVFSSNIDTMKEAIHGPSSVTWKGTEITIHGVQYIALTNREGCRVLMLK
jgi:hypothetical protein